MKNKYALMIIGTIGISLLFSACSKADIEIDKSAQVDHETQGKQTSNQQSNSEQNDRGRSEFQRPDIYGRVKSIIGNEVVLEFIEIPERTGVAPQGGTAQQTPGRQAGSGGAMPSGGAVPGGGGGPMPTGGGQQRTNREIKLTGETKTILIPVGIPIITLGQNTQKELDLADIYQGMMMQIWLDANDNEMITQIRVMQGR